MMRGIMLTILLCGTAIPAYGQDYRLDGFRGDDLAIFTADGRFVSREKVTEAMRQSLPGLALTYHKSESLYSVEKGNGRLYMSSGDLKVSRNGGIPLMEFCKGRAGRSNSDGSSALGNLLQLIVKLRTYYETTHIGDARRCDRNNSLRSGSHS